MSLDFKRRTYAVLCLVSVRKARKNLLRDMFFLIMVLSYYGVVETPFIIFYIDYKIKIVIMLVFLVLQRLQKKYDYVRRYPVIVLRRYPIIVLRLCSKVKNFERENYRMGEGPSLRS